MFSASASASRDQMTVELGLPSQMESGGVGMVGVPR
jgi:hypothetical protein